MRENGFLLNHIVPYNSKIYDSYVGEHRSMKTRILAYFMEWM